MARRGSPPSFRLISPRTLRWLGATLLALCLAVAALGLVTALYLDRALESSQSAAPALVPMPPSAALDPLAKGPAPQPETDNDANLARDAIAAPADTTAAMAAAPTVAPAAEPLVSPIEPDTLPDVAAATAALATIEPRSGTSATDAAEPSPPPVAAMPDPRPRPGPSSPPIGWSMEYGVFARDRAAKRLQQELARHGLEAFLVATHTPSGRPLLRVRSTLLADRPAAQAASATAARALGIAPLVHRARSIAQPEKQYWVQFGAFPRYQQATRLHTKLAAHGVATTVHSARTKSGKVLFLVRSTGYHDRALAVAAGLRGEAAAKVSFFVGERPAPLKDEPRRSRAAPTPGLDRSG
jgi:cell division septation protein DedD